MAKKLKHVDPMHHFNAFEDYRMIPGLHPGYKINIKGEIINPMGYLVPTYKTDSHGAWVYVIIRKTNSGVSIDTTELVNRAVLVSVTARNTVFQIHPSRINHPHPLSKATMYFLDGDCTNVHPSNTIIAPLPKDVEYKSGWRYIPGFSNYVINKKGELWSFLRNKINIWGQNNSEDYLICNAVADIVSSGRKDRNYNLKQHRALMLAWSDYPSNVGQLHVNHLNAIRYDNELSNLEWCTPQQNNRHAIELGLRKLMPIKTIDVLTGEERRFISAAETSRFYATDIGAIIARCKSDGQLVYKPATLFKYADSPTPWPDLEYAKKHLVSNDGYYTYTEKDGIITKYNDAGDLPEIIDVNKNTLFSQLQRRKVGKYNGFYVWRSISPNG